MHAARHQAGEMRHIDHEIGADLVGDRAKAPKIDDARIGRAAGDDQLRPMLLCQPLGLVHVDQVIVAADAVRNRLEPAAGQIDRRAVGQMAAGGEVEPHEGVARPHQRQEHLGVGGRAGMRLHVGKGAAEQLGHALDREPLDDVDELAAAVIALARQPFGILVGEDRALRLQHGAADDILGRNQLDLVALPAQFAPDRICDFRVAFAQNGGEETLLRERCTMRTRTVRDRHCLAALVFALRTPSRGRPTLADSIPADGCKDFNKDFDASRWAVTAGSPLHLGRRPVCGRGRDRLAVTNSWSRPALPTGRPCRKCRRGIARHCRRPTRR